MSDVEDISVYAGPDPYRATVTNDPHYGLRQAHISVKQVLNIIEAMNDGTLDDVLSRYPVGVSDGSENTHLAKKFREAATRYLFR